MTRLILVTGLSGSGKTVALHTLEDEGYFCIDNLPANLLVDILDRLIKDDLDLYQRLAVGIDMRSERGSTAALLTLIAELRRRDDAVVDVMFLDTDRSTLVTRFSETRRKHPMTSDGVPLISAIDEEARILETVKSRSDLVIDTSALNLHELRDIIRTHVISKTAGGLALILQSFGFKHGTPASTDLMFDVRCLPNPHWVPDLRTYTGQQPPVIEYLEKHESVSTMFEDIRQFIDRWLPQFEAENRAYLTVSIGCTGGRHRSVYLAERLHQYFSAKRDNVSLRHREIA